MPAQKLLSPVLKKGYVDTSHGQIHYRYIFPSTQTTIQKEPIIFLHKSASSSASYELLMQYYASQGYACYAPDMPGFGGSFDPSKAAIAEIEEQGTVWYSATFMQAFEALGLAGNGCTTPCHIIGHHSGAVLAVEFAARYPEFVATICLVGPTVMSVEERAAMKEIFFKPFNEPARDGSHLLKTWEYLGNMGVGEDITLWQREAVDHIRAWKGRMLIYGAVWAQKSEDLYKQVSCPILLMCARDDVLWRYFGHVHGLREGVQAIEITGGNFEPDRDVEGIAKALSPFLTKYQ
ncbi:alpha/beta-hydrolase [Eremomyces bilateralis CBS 781.70]|uniref:Alpha/beta-hydrolase n=1 Tax=Eremomyces bilateralis CBS 781.70 TaxID=1392243 RepID=A0A6G1GCD4_9PEZI|nr:alpha/beta-hydrolase [Eremomyces bilateralis CBS 781.70]KAF1815652.1 alpha/beta-hydrolase [Eremomyces bilateralis CBS 781.70]